MPREAILWCDSCRLRGISETTQKSIKTGLMRVQRSDSNSPPSRERSVTNEQERQRRIAAQKLVHARSPEKPKPSVVTSVSTSSIQIKEEAPCRTEQTRKFGMETNQMHDIASNRPVWTQLEQVAAADEVFDHMDLNGDGIIDRAEFAAAMMGTSVNCPAPHHPQWQEEMNCRDEQPGLSGQPGLLWSQLHTQEQDDAMRPSDTAEPSCHQARFATTNTGQTKQACEFGGSNAGIWRQLGMMDNEARGMKGLFDQLQQQMSPAGTPRNGEIWEMWTQMASLMTIPEEVTTSCRHDTPHTALSSARSTCVCWRECSGQFVVQVASRMCPLFVLMTPPMITTATSAVLALSSLPEIHPTNQFATV